MSIPGSSWEPSWWREGGGLQGHKDEILSSISLYGQMHTPPDPEGHGVGYTPPRHPDYEQEAHDQGLPYMTDPDYGLETMAFYKPGGPKRLTQEEREEMMGWELTPGKWGTMGVVKHHLDPRRRAPSQWWKEYVSGSPKSGFPLKKNMAAGIPAGARRKTRSDGITPARMASYGQGGAIDPNLTYYTGGQRMYSPETDWSQRSDAMTVNQYINQLTGGTPPPPPDPTYG